MYRAAALLFGLATVAYAQQAGTLSVETHPSLPIQQCSIANGASSCQTLTTKIVLDANWRWTHYNTGNTNTNCYGTTESATGWDQTVCPTNGDAGACSVGCAVDGIDYQNAVGISADGKGSVTLDFVTQYTNEGQTSTNVGSRVFLMDQDDSNYMGFNLLNQEFTFTVNASNVPCGVNGAAYFVQMQLDGGLSESPTYNGQQTNTAGPQFGTGYCDSTCTQGLKFIGGLANSPSWNETTAAGATGTCCTEMDIWEANQMSAAMTPHPCNVQKQVACTGASCGSSYTGSTYDGVCDKDGCDFNSFRMGNATFYGPSTTNQPHNIDSTKPITVVTQFITNNNTDAGTLSQIKRIYYQNGEIIANSNSDVSGVPNQNWIDDKWCTAQKKEFGDPDTFGDLKGLSTISDSMRAGHVLVLSIWDDSTSYMNWLDSVTPNTATPPYAPGVQRGSCDPTAGVPGTVQKGDPGASVTYSNIKFGPIGSTSPGS